jgi:fructoselysine 6-kinase
MRVIGFGDNVVDKYLHTKTYYPGGNCVNFAVYANKLGAESAYLGVLGTDEMAQHILNTLSSFNIDVSHCIQLAGDTGCCEVTLENGDRKFVSWNGGGVTLEKPMILQKKDLDYLNQFQLIHSGCYAKSETEIVKLRKLDAKVSFDFSEDFEFRTDEYLQKVCPYIDFALFSCFNQSLDEIKSLIQKVSALGPKYILATRGVKGSVFYDGYTFYESASLTVENPVDTMGCGDSFVTSFLVSLLENGWDKNECIVESCIREGLKKAATFAADNCYVKGAFDHGRSFE